MDRQEMTREEVAVDFSLQKDERASDAMVTVFTTVLTTEGLTNFLIRSRDKNYELHDPARRGIVQGLLWFTLCNAAVSEAVPNAVMVAATLSPKGFCIAKGSSSILVTLKVAVTPTENGRLVGSCEVWAPMRRGSVPALVFVAEGIIQPF